MDGNNGEIIFWEGQAENPNVILHSEEGLQAMTEAAIAVGAVGASILMPGAATLVLGETGGALFVGGAGLLGSGYGVYDGAGALGEWIGSENLSIVEKLELSLRIGNAALGTVTGPFAGVGLLRSGLNPANVYRVYGGTKIVSGGLSDTSENILKTGPTAPNYYRYMSEAEVNAINETGLLRGGISGETYFTTDFYRTGAKAKKRLSLYKTPTQRVEFVILNKPKMEIKGTKVTPANGQPGKGTEFMTNDPVKVKITNNQLLRK